MRKTLLDGGKILICGNGGSAADAQHMAAELTCRFEIEREPWPAIALHCDTSHVTACGNDYGYDRIFEKGINAHGKSGDSLVAISTSGNSPNVMLAIEAAKKKGVKVIGLLGKDGGKIAKMPLDACVIVPHNSTAIIQESHIATIHIWCRMIDSLNTK